jgi:hypothetical protein
MEENIMRENKRMELNMDDLAYVSGGEESILDRICNRAKRIGQRFIDMIDSIDL